MKLNLGYKYTTTVEMSLYTAVTGRVHWQRERPVCTKNKGKQLRNPIDFTTTQLPNHTGSTDAKNIFIRLQCGNTTAQE